MNDHSYFIMTKPQPDTKSNIRREALGLFAERGYAAVSMLELADAVGMRQGGLYNHFPSKQALLVDLMATHMADLLQDHEIALDGIEGARARIEAFVRHHVTYHLDYPKDVFLAHMELRSLDADNRRSIVIMRDQYEQALRRILKEGKDKGVFRIDDVAMTARMLLSMLTGVTAWYRKDGAMSPDAIVESHLRAALQCLGLEVAR